MDSHKLFLVFDEFWAKLPQKPCSYYDTDCSFKSVRVQGVLNPEDDIACGMHDMSITSTILRSYDDDPELMQVDAFMYYSGHPHLRPEEKVYVDKVRFVDYSKGNRFDIEVCFTIVETVPSTGVERKRAEGYLSLTMLDEGKDAAKFLRMAKDALAARKRPVYITSDLDDLD